MSNYTILVNHTESGFGCSKACSYCNWRGHELLPHGLQPRFKLDNFIKECNKDFVTVSGGGDPLYKFDQYGARTIDLFHQIRKHGKKARLITREVDHIEKLKGHIDYISISLDQETFHKAMKLRSNWNSLNIEYSLVLPPYPPEEIFKLKGYYESLQRKLGHPLVLRENLNSIFEIEVSQFHFEGCYFVSKYTCLRSVYYTRDKACLGTEISTDMGELFRYLTFKENVYVYGGLLKHLIAPTVHTNFSDIDLCITNESIMLELGSLYDFKETSKEGQYPAYFHGISKTKNVSLHIVRFINEEDIQKFIFNNQLDVDRVYRSRNNLMIGNGIEKQDLIKAITSKQGTYMQSPDKSMYAPTRRVIERRYESKLLQKGWILK